MKKMFCELYNFFVTPLCMMRQAGRKTRFVTFTLSQRADLFSEPSKQPMCWCAVSGATLLNEISFSQRTRFSWRIFSIMVCCIVVVLGVLFRSNGTRWLVVLRLLMILERYKNCGLFFFSVSMRVFRFSCEVFGFLLCVCGMSS